MEGAPRPIQMPSRVPRISTLVRGGYSKQHFIVEMRNFLAYFTGKDGVEQARTKKADFHEFLEKGYNSRVEWLLTMTLDHQLTASDLKQISSKNSANGAFVWNAYNSTIDHIRKMINTTWVDCNGGKGPLPSGTNADEIAELVKVKLFENEREERARALKKQDAAERVRAIQYEADQFEPDCWAV